MALEALVSGFADVKVDEGDALGWTKSMGDGSNGHALVSLKSGPVRPVLNLQQYDLPKWNMCDYAEEAKQKSRGSFWERHNLGAAFAAGASVARIG